MSAGANPYRTKLWELLAEETQNEIMKRMDRRIEWTDYEQTLLPDYVVPPEMLRAFQEEYGAGATYLSCDFTFAFDRSKKVLGLLTAKFSKCIVTDRDNFCDGDFPEDLDLDDVAGQLDYHRTYNDIIKIRLLDHPPPAPTPMHFGDDVSRAWSIELTQRQIDGTSEVILVNPEFLLNPGSHAILVQQMQEKLHMIYRVVGGVEQFTRL